MAGKSFRNIEYCWQLRENSAYEYYVTQLEKQMEIFDTIYKDNRAYVSYLGYKIMVFEVGSGSIFLINDGKIKKKVHLFKKLDHEYCEMFNIYKMNTK